MGADRRDRPVSRPPRPEEGGGRPRRPPDRAERDKAEAAADAKIRAVLTPAQAKRLGEIQIQTMGLTAAMVPAVQTRLGLTENQKAKLKALLPAQGRGGRGGPGRASPGRRRSRRPARDGGGLGGPPPAAPVARAVLAAKAVPVDAEGEAAWTPGAKSWKARSPRS